MLTTAKHMGESLEDYYKTDHPVQQRIMEVISDISETPLDEIEIGIDGCGVPVHGIPLKNLALVLRKWQNLHLFQKNEKMQLSK